MRENRISFLPADKIRIAKKVTLVAKFGEQEFSIGYFLYERLFNENYKMLEVPEEEKDFTYRFEYPQERLFPIDEIDNLILQSVTKRYPKAGVRSFLIASTLEQENLTRMTDRPFETGKFVFHPSLANVDINQFVGKEFIQLSTDIKVYNDFRNEEIRSLTFVGYFDVRDRQILDKAREVRFL